MTSLTAWIVYGVAGLVPVLLHLRATRRAHAAAELALAESRTSRLTAPPSLHPAINPNRCLGCGSCVGACPEGDVLGLIAGKAMLVNPTHCIGHGACREACPTDAITLVLGTEERGVDVPHLGPDFQTNVPGLFVAGELGGMGLIRNAVEQGRQAVDSIRRLSGIGGGDGLDLVVVGAGPAGLAASLAARQHSLRVVTLEQDSLGGAVAHYPRGKLVMTAPLELPGFGPSKAPWPTPIISIGGATNARSPTSRPSELMPSISRALVNRNISRVSTSRRTSFPCSV